MLKLKTGYVLGQEVEMQAALNKKLVIANKEMKRLNINSNKIYKGNMDFAMTEDLVGFTHCVYLRGIDEDVVIEELNSYKIIIEVS